MRAPISPLHTFATLAVAALCLAAAPIHAQVTFTGTEAPLLTGFLTPSSVALDPAGNLYVNALETIVDPMFGTYYQTTIYKETLSNGAYTQSIVTGIGGTSPAYLAVDQAGTVYIAAPGQYAIYSFSSTGGFGYYPQSGPPHGIAVDNAGHIFYSIGTTIRQLTISTDNSIPVITGLNAPSALAVDASGNLYVSDPGATSIYLETPSNGSYTQSTIASVRADSLTLDSSGNLYAVNTSGALAFKLTQSNSVWSQSSLPGSYSSPTGIAIGANGATYVTDQGTGNVDQLLAGSNYNFGSQPVSAASKTVPLFFSVAAGTTIGSASVLTTGTPNKDFTDAGASTCTAQTYASATSCVVNVTLTPRAPGTRRGAVVLRDGSGNLLSSTAVYGIGTGPQLIYTGPLTEPVLLNGVAPNAMTTDGAGNIYVSESNCDCVLKIAPGGATTQIGAGLFGYPYGVAINGAGDLYVADKYGAAIYVFPAQGSYYTIPLPSGAYPYGLAFDGQGNLYYTDQGNQNVSMITPSGVNSIVSSNFAGPAAIALDTAGNFYVTDVGYGVLFYNTPQGAQTILDSTGSSDGFASLVLDPAGNLFYGDPDANTLLEIPAGGSPTVVQRYILPWALALDGSGNLYWGDRSFYQIVAKIDRQDAPSFAFAPTTGGSTSADSPKAATIQNIGNAPLNIASVVYPADFPEDSSGIATDCAAGSLPIAGTCTFTFDFTPTSAGGASTTALLESLKLTSNNYGIANNVQRIYLSGTAAKRPSTVTFSTSNATPTLGSGYSLTATPAGSAGTPTGIVNIYSGGVFFAAVPVTSGVATLQPGITLSAGKHTLTATYAGDSTYTASTSSPIVVTVAKATTTIGLTGSATTASTGKPISFTATVPSTIGVAPTGTVNFYAGGVLIGSSTLTSGQAIYSTSTLAVGSRTITATYAGDNNYNPVTSTGYKVTITK